MMKLTNLVRSNVRSCGVLAAFGIIATGTVVAPAVAKPAAPAPASSPATAPKPAEPAKPAEAKPAEAKPAEVKPAEAGKPVTLPSGVIVEDLALGTGYEVKAGGAVVAHYKGTLKSDGTEFDSSYKRGQPIGFPLTGVIKGWQEGVPGMKVGGKRKLTIPAAQAYGEQEKKDRSGKIIIPKNSDLVFEIELVNALQSEDITVGTGDECKPNQTVKLHYKGTLKSDGSEFDSSYKTGQPAEFPLPSLIQGWQYGVPGMKVGGKRKLIIPWQFGYGEVGSPPNIPGKADLVFEIELLGVK